MFLTCSERFYQKDKFSKQARSIGEIKVYQPSGEMCQQIDEKIHDQKALTKITLSRVLGQRPDTLLLACKSWLLYQPRDAFAFDPPCIRSTSIVPCHLTSPSQGCDAE
ncbi:hypothetical protein HID58_055719 [Brassica napus]|uniref:Fucosyltransferase n=1 Tax=Brassica napus TaxID=3708 RepID=A0ABQ8AMP9_BRANA|nr:hypothetical protein HID58_055719 [Brassica napus]